LSIWETDIWCENCSQDAPFLVSIQPSSNHSELLVDGLVLSLVVCMINGESFPSRRDEIAIEYLMNELSRSAISKLDKRSSMPSMLIRFIFR
jgi:hypothetical protein